MNRDQHITQSLRSAAVTLKSAVLISQLQFKKIVKVNYTGSDLRLTLDDGRMVLISAVEQDGKPYLETDAA